jgi:hypothetical protein
MVFHRILDFTTRLDFYPASIFLSPARKPALPLRYSSLLYLLKPSSLIVFVLDYFYASKSIEWQIY